METEGMKAKKCYVYLPPDYAYKLKELTQALQASESKVLTQAFIRYVDGAEGQAEILAGQADQALEIKRLKDDLTSIKKTLSKMRQVIGLGAFYARLGSIFAEEPARKVMLSENENKPERWEEIREEMYHDAANWAEEKGITRDE